MRVESESVPSSTSIRILTTAHRYFYWRLRRRLQEEAASKKLAKADPTLSRAARMEIVQATVNTGSIDMVNDEAVAIALEDATAAIEAQVKAARAAAISETILAMSSEDHDAVMEAMKRVLGERLAGDDLAVRTPLSLLSLIVLVLTRRSPRRRFLEFFLLRRLFSSQLVDNLGVQ